MSNPEQDFYDFMEGYCYAFKDLPDGAFTQACQDGVRAWNDEYNDNKNPLSGVLAWMKQSKEI